MIYLPALVKKPEEDIISFSQGALSGCCVNRVTWDAIPGRMWFKTKYSRWVFTKVFVTWNTGVSSQPRYCVFRLYGLCIYCIWASPSWKGWRSGVLLSHVVVSACKEEQLCPAVPHIERLETCLRAGGAGPPAKRECQDAGNDWGCVWEGKGEGKWSLGKDMVISKGVFLGWCCVLQESQYCQHLPGKGRKLRWAIKWGKEPVLC